MPTSRSSRSGSRWLVILYGLLVFFWLSPEDDQTWPAILLGLAGVFLLVRAWSAPRVLPFKAVVMGGAVGFGTSLLTVVLMILKNARHAHLYPDFSAPLMLDVLERTPYWTAAGLLVGLGVWVLRQ